MNSKRILFVLEHFYPFVGGVSVLFQELAKELITSGYSVDVITTKLPKTAAFEEWEGIKIHRVATPPFSRRYWFTICSLPLLNKLAKNAEIIQTTTYNAAIPAWIIGKINRKPVVITVHEVWGKRWFSYPGIKFLNWIYWIIEHAIVNLPFARLVADSQATAKDLIAARRSMQGVEVVYLGIDTNLFNPNQINYESARSKIDFLDGYWFVNYGRPGISKGIEYLVEAMPAVAKECPKARLLLILNQDPKDRYQAICQLVKKHNAHDYIKIIEPVPRSELPIYIAAADSVVVPSLAEGFGFTAAEACAMNRPVVTTTAGSLPEVISGKALMVKPANTEAIARAMISAIQNQFVEYPKKEFSWRQTADGYLKIYEEVSR